MKNKIQKYIEALRLRESGGYSANYTAQLVGLSDKTITRIWGICDEHQINYDKTKSMGHKELKLLFNKKRELEKDKILPDYETVHKKMQAHKHSTLIQLWHEYKADFLENAYCYSQFTHHYRKFLAKVDLSMRQTHYAGELVFVDYAGKLIPWTDPKTGEVNYAQVFVGVQGCSQYTFAWASKSQKVEDFIEAHKQMFNFFGGVPEAVVPDNLKSAVTSAGSNPIVNRTYLEMARHYNLSIIPARVRKPQDKSLAEIGVLLVTRWITVPLTRRKFFSIEEINQAISELLPKLNDRNFKRISGSRASRFLELDKPLLRALPNKTFECANWMAKQKVSPDYHVYVKGHAYSVPYLLVSEYVEARVTAKLVEFYHDGKRVAAHTRNDTQGEHTTNPLHRPASHQAYAEQSLQHYLKWAQSIGSYSVQAIKAQFDNKPEHSLIANKACSQLQQLAKIFGHERFEAACIRGKAINSLTVKSIRSILQHRLDQQVDDSVPEDFVPNHQNVRGSSYYQGDNSYVI